MKRFATVTLAFVLLLAFIALADETKHSGDFKYHVLDNGTAEITQYIGKDGTVEIPSQLDGKKVTSIGKEAFYNCTGLTSVAIPEGVTNIGDNAFYFCENLSSVTIPDGLTRIGNSSFFCCTSLQSITIPNSIKSMGSNPFEYCYALTDINVAPENEYLATIDGP